MARFLVSFFLIIIFNSFGYDRPSIGAAVLGRSLKNNMPTQRPTIFIGSSSEGLDTAEAIQLNLSHKCQITIWSQGVFGLSHGTLETLTSILNRYDFAILVLTPDDLVTSRKETIEAPRDNVLLELGMFIGAIGTLRTFIVHDRSVPLKLPTDLAGITPATYVPHDDGNLQAAVGPVCTQIKQSISELGVRSRSELTGVIEIDESFLIVSDLIGDPGNQFIIQMYEVGASFVRDNRSIVGKSEGYEWSKDKGGGGVGGFDLDKFCKQLPDADILKQNLRNELTLTKRGEQYAAWLIKNNKKADYFRSSAGEWGKKPDWLAGMNSERFLGQPEPEE